MNLDERAVRAAHASYHQTRCGGWLQATGMRPVVPEPAPLAKGPQRVALRAVPKPGAGCDLHPIEEAP